MMNTESNANGRVTRVEYLTSRDPMMFGSDLDVTPLPGRGLLYSVLVHGFLVLAFVYVPWSYWLPREVRLVTAQSMIPTHEVLLLPALEPLGSGGSAASSSNSGNSKQKDAAAPSSEAKARQGVVYKGPQLIVSDPAHPDNFVQTIRQPGLVAPPRLPAPLPLPPIVSVASVKPELAPPAPQPPPEVPQNKPLQVVASAPLSPRVEAPKMPLPAAISADALVHAVVADAVPAPMPKLAHQDPPAKTEKKERNILVVDAYSMPESKPSAIPPGELYGTFTLSPVGATAIGLAGGGVEIKGAPGVGNASGIAAGASAAGPATTPNAGIGNKPAGGAGEGKAVRAAVPAGTGAGRGGTGGGAGFGAGVHTSGNGNAPGTGFGSSPFPAIMIQGGRAGGDRSIAGTGGAGTTVAGASKPQTSYEITIVASGASGGGFKDFGVFRDEASYTVYLDMADAGAHGSSWTLQYAMDSHPAQAPSVPASRAHGQLVPPYATSKLLPRFSSEAAKRARGGTIVVFGVINQLGRIQDLRIMQSPDPGLNQFMLESLAKWTFRPAQVDGVQVSVKILLGVPVDSVPESDSSLRIGSTRGISHETTRF